MWYSSAEDASTLYRELASYEDASPYLRLTAELRDWAQRTPLGAALAWQQGLDVGGKELRIGIAESLDALTDVDAEIHANLFAHALTDENPDVRSAAGESLELAVSNAAQSDRHRWESSVHLLQRIQEAHRAGS